MVYDIMPSPVGPIFFSRNEEGLDRVHFLDSHKPFPGLDASRQNDRDPLLRETRRQLAAYFSGHRRHFSLPVSLRGTDFQVRVWNALATIPYGKTWTYKELARSVGSPAAFRAVGNANAKNRLPILLA